MKKILVVGGAGYIGSHTVRYLIKNNYDVLIVDNLEYGHEESVDNKAVFIKLDLKNKHLLNQVFRKHKPDIVIDFAAYTSVGESMTQVDRYIENNVFNFLNLLEVMAENNCNYLVKSSTAATYGNPLKENDFPLKEDYQKHHYFTKSHLLSGKIADKNFAGEEFFKKIITKIQNRLPKYIKLSNCDLSLLRIPTSVYGLTKMADEILMKKFWKKYRLNSVSLRYFNACGADDKGDIGEDHNPELSLIPNVISAVLGQKPVFSLNGNDYPTSDGTCIRDYIHVNDLATGHLKASQYLYKTQGFHIFNLGNGKGYSNYEVIKATEKISARKIKVNILPKRSGDPAISYADIQKANRLLDWQPKYDLNMIIKTALKWHKNHPRGYSK